MGEQTDTDQLIQENPLEVSYDTIYNALLNVFPDHANLILSYLRRIILIEKNLPWFSTMGVSREGDLYISKEFWDKYMIDKDALSTVLSHELRHCLSADIYTIKSKEDGDDYELQNSADLIAMDARINAYICMTRPDIFPEDFLSSFYNSEAIANEPLHALLTPSGYLGDMQDPDLKELQDYHTKFYNTEEFCSHHELSEKILKILKKRPKQKTLTIKLIGGHGQGGKELTEEDFKDCDQIIIEQEDPGKFREESYDSIDTSASQCEPQTIEEKIKEIVKDTMAQQSANSAGKGNASSVNFIKLCDKVTEKLDISKFKKMMVDSLFHNVRTQAREKTSKYSTSPLVPTRISTTDLLLLSAGATPLLWKTPKYQYKFNNALLPIYLDVSGSTYSYLTRIVKLITNISTELEYVWGFSNKVAKHTVDQLREGKLNTTGGTDFDCILDHAKENKYKHIVVISDGCAYCRLDATKKKQEGLVSVVSVLFGYANQNNYFSNVYGNTKMIEEVII